MQVPTNEPFAAPAAEYTVVRLTLPDHHDGDVDAHETRGDDSDDLVYMPQRTTQDTVDLLHAAVVLDFNSFDGGERCAGRLRDGGPEPVSLFSRQCIGLAVSAALAGFCVAFFASAFRPLFLTAYLRPLHADLASLTESLLQWPPVLSLFIGVLSDAVPLNGYHRKPYLLSGWLLASLAVGAAALVSSSCDLTDPKTAVVLVALSILSSCGIQIVWVVSLAITVEHAQRETTQERGHFQGAFFLVYYAATALTHAITTRLLVTTNADPAVETMISLQHVLILISCTAMAAIPGLLWFYHEHRGAPERDTAAKFSSADLTSSGLSTHLQQKPAYRIYFFLCGAAFLVTARSDSVDRAVLSWCGISKQKFGNITVAQAMPKVVAVLIWKCFMLNLNWRVLGVAGLAMYSLCSLGLVVTTGFDLVRGEWVYYGWTAVASIPLGWVEVFMVILPTEVAGVGREGLAISIVASFMGLLGILSTTLWETINSAAGLLISTTEMAVDDTATRERVVLIGVAYALLNLSSVVLTPLLPPQKLDAQRWRAFGRANKPTSRSLVIAFLVLVLYNLAANWLQVRSR